jgi:hypothetical protein
MAGREGQFFVTMPARKARNGQLRDIAHPLNSETRQEIEDRVLAEFKRAVDDRVVPDRARGGQGNHRRQSVVDRLSAKLFVEDFWTGDPTPDAKEKG